jgi:hypothetical protein
MPRTNRKNLLFALLFIAVGAFIVAISAGWVPVDDADVNAPLWLLALVGGIFALAGVMVLYGRDSRVNDLLAAILMAAMGIIGGWVAVYSASGDISGGVFFLPRDMNVMLGRILFGSGSLICFGVAAYAVSRFLNRG